MQKCRNSLLASVAAMTVLSLLSSAPARADALTPILGQFTAHFNIMEDVFNPGTGTNSTSLAVGDQNYGIALLGNIISTSGGIYGGPGTGDYLVAVFGGITVA